MRTRRWISVIAIGVLVIAQSCADPRVVDVDNSGNDGGGVADVIINKYGGDLQTGVPCGPLADSLLVFVAGPSGQPDGGASVSWSTRSGDKGSVSPAITVTDARGLTSARWTLGCAGGEQEVYVVTSAATNPATFTATAIAPPDTTGQHQ